MASITTVYRWGALAFMAGSALFLLNKADAMSARFLARPLPDLISGDRTALVLVGQVAFALGLVAYYRLYAPRLGRAGRVALGLFAGGGIVLMLGHVTFLKVLHGVGPAAGLAPQPAEYAFFLVILGLLLMVAGLIAFGILNLRQPGLVRWRWLPLATGILALGFALTSGEEITVTHLAIRTLFAFGLFGLGWAMWLDSPAAAPLAAADPLPVDG